LAVKVIGDEMWRLKQNARKGREKMYVRKKFPDGKGRSGFELACNNSFYQVIIHKPFLLILTTKVEQIA
jgi:hypothetical protein